MTRPAFAIPVAELEQDAKTVSFRVPQAWLEQAFAGTDAEPQGEGSLEVELMKTGPNVMVRGQAKAQVTVPCVVTLDPLPFELAPEIFLMLSPAEGATIRNPATRRLIEKHRDPGAAGASRPARKRAKNRIAGADEAADEGVELGSEDAARDTFDGEIVVLDDFLREFLVLELPLYPRRADLPSEPTPAIAPPSPATEPKATVDPRLQPLAAIAKRLEEQKKE
jgi:uncharacterized metal-binding protein YceD (DUF177 family)